MKVRMETIPSKDSVNSIILWLNDNGKHRGIGLLTPDFDKNEDGIIEYWIFKIFKNGKEITLNNMYFSELKEKLITEIENNLLEYI